MAIVSVSLDEESLKILQSVQAELGYSGRSEAVRGAIHLLEAERLTLEKLSGNRDGIILVIHGKKHGGGIPGITHAYSGLIRSQLHTHLANQKCMDLFVVAGDGEDIVGLAEALQGSKNVELVKVVAP